MEFLQNIDPSHYPFIAAGFALLCVALIVVGFVLQAVSSIFEVVIGLIEVAVDILQGGPVSWCGCTLLIAALIACAGATFLWLDAPATCAANPTRFCLWFGFLP